MSARYRSSRAQLHVAYTWSHNIDNQSEPLAGDFYDLLPTRPGASVGASLPATFSDPNNSRADRGNSDFDQRHNLVAFGIWQLPQPPARSRGAAWLRDCGSFLAAVRSGFYTVTANSLGQRLNWCPPLALPPRESRHPRQFFDSAAFDYAPADASEHGPYEFAVPSVHRGYFCEPLRACTRSRFPRVA